MFKNNVKTEKYGNCHHALNRSLQVHRYGSCFFLILGNIEVLVLIIRTEIDSREAYSCKRLVRIYFGSLKQTLIASFLIPCRRDSCVLGAAMKAILLYSIFGLDYPWIATSSFGNLCTIDNRDMLTTLCLFLFWVDMECLREWSHSVERILIFLIRWM